MIVVMQQHCSEEAIEHVLHFLNDHGLSGHPSRGVERTIIGVLGAVGPSGTPSSIDGINPDLGEALEALPCVEEVLRVSKPYKLASREMHSADTFVRTAQTVIGPGTFTLIAGPCSVENEDLILRTADCLLKHGVRLMRAGAFKPRTSPYSFQGLKEKGLQLLAEARDETGLAVVTEVMASEHVPLVKRYADVLQVGARNMQNYPLLEAVGESGMPVLLKRGPSATMEEFLLAAEYVLNAGNQRVMLCERGIRTFEDHTRFTLPLVTVPYLHQHTHLPVVVDPSHGTGKASLVATMARASVAAGADGLIVEVHPDPEKALSDGYQTLTLPAFRDLMAECRKVALAVGREM